MWPTFSSSRVKFLISAIDRGVYSEVITMTFVKESHA